MVRHTEAATEELAYDRVSYDVVDDGVEAGDDVTVEYESPYSGTVVTVDGTATDVSATCVTVELEDGRVWGIFGRGIRTTENSRRASGTVDAKNGRKVGYVESLTFTKTVEREVACDGGTVAGRRTRADLRYLANAVRGARVDTDEATDPSRNSRLVDHGWFTSQGGVTADGAELARAVGTLANDDVEHDDLDYAIDVMGMGTFVDEARRASSSVDFAGYVRGILVVANTIDEARHHAGTQDVEYDHDGLFEGHFADEGFDARNGKVEVRFEREATARVWAVEDAPDRFDIEYKHDERFNGNRNPRRLVVDVMA